MKTNNNSPLLLEWAVSVGTVVLRIIWMALFAASTIGLLRLCAWADTGMRGDQPPMEEVLP